MLSCLFKWWSIGTNPLRAVTEVSYVSIEETAGDSNWHELCHVDGDGVCGPEAADVSLMGAGGRAPGSWLELTPLSRDSNCHLAIANHSTEITTSPTFILIGLAAGCSEVVTKLE